MRWHSRTLFSAACGLALAGCSTPERTRAPAAPPRPIVDDSPRVVQAMHAEPAADKPGDGAAIGITPAQLDALVLEHHPRLAQVGWAVEAARGRAVQAGLYPNPTVGITADELGDRQGTLGIITAPQVSQEIVRGGKLELSRAVADREVDRATLAVVAERYRLLTDARQSYWDAVALQRRAAVLEELIALANQSVENAEKLLKAKEASELDLVQLEVDRERYRAELDAARQSLPAVLRRLAASTGNGALTISSVAGDLELALPEYDLDRVKSYVDGVHPAVQSARIGVERARLAVRRAEVEPIPNVTVGAGYVRQNQNRSNDWMVGVSVPIPLWNKNQGNILAARAELGEAINAVGRAQNDLAVQLANAFAVYSAAKARAEKYKSAILPKAETSLQLSRKAYQGGQFEYLRVLQAQRAVAEVRLDYVRSLGEAWRAAGEIAGLMLEDHWPAASVPPAIERKQP